MKTWIVRLLFITIALSCNKDDVAGDAPDCIKENIETNKSDPGWGTAAWKRIDTRERDYLYNRIAGFADAAISIVTQDRNTLCSLGVIAGNSMCRGEKFYDKAQYLKTI